MIKSQAETILGLEGSYTRDELKKLHRKLLLECHPDSRGSGAGDTLAKQINAAYELLENEFQRTGLDTMTCDTLASIDVQAYEKQIADLKKTMGSLIAKNLALEHLLRSNAEAASSQRQSAARAPNANRQRTATSTREGPRTATRAPDPPPPRQEESSNVGCAIFMLVAFFAVLFYLMYTISALVPPGTAGG